jgi:hypothetical protein
MDNERPIEKLLRDYAKKRRADAGEPRELHPATRRLLQGEVSRQFPKPQRRGSLLAEFFARWRPGLTYALCVLALVAISVPLLLPTFREAQSGNQQARAVVSEAEADNQSRAAVVAQETDEARPAGRSNEAGQVGLAFTEVERAKDSASNFKLEEEKQKSQTARMLATDTLARSAPATPPAPQIAGRDQTQAVAPLAIQSYAEQPVREFRADDAKALPVESRRTFAEQPAALAAEKLGASRAAPPPASTDSVAGTAGVALAARAPGFAPTAATPATALPDATESAAFRQRYGLAPTASAAIVQGYSQTANAAKFRRATGAGADASPVLTTFQLEQTGDQLRVIDSDGSTYTGQITSSAPNLTLATKVELKGATPRKADDKSAVRASSAPPDSYYQAGQNYFFHVTGTNRTLQQPVVFAGNLLILTNAPATGQTVLTQAPAARSQNQLAPRQNPLPILLNSTISGNVQLGTNREMQINAVPVNP